MKKPNLTFVFCLTVYFLSAQDYLVTFSGSGESTTVSTVIVENMTQGKSLTLNGNETLHLKNDVTEISDLEYNQIEGIHFYPNPMKEFSIMEFVMPGEGNANVELFDISGRKLTQTQNYLNPGSHSFRITGVGYGIYVLKVTAGNYLYSGKLISDKQTGEMVNITYQNTIPFNDNPAVMKSAKSEILMQYNTGDMLKFFATGGEHKSVKVEVISESKNVDFVFYKCTDSDKRNYATVKIGNQIWLAENLAYLPEVSPSGFRTPRSQTEPYYYVYDYQGFDVAAAKDNQNYKDYGVLYNWPAAKAACPPGWHLPSNDEWKALTNWLGEWEAGYQMKATSGWYGNGNGTNTSGFSALPGGYLSSNMIATSFEGVTYYGYWWSSTAEYIDNVVRLSSHDFGVTRSSENRDRGFSVRCVRDDNITTTAITDIKQTTATSGGILPVDGGETITACGVCWNTTGSPTISDSKTNNETGTGSFTSSLTGLIPGTLYYVRAYATNSQGTAYGSQIIFTTSNPTGAFTDSRDGRTYNTIIIKGKEWMAENLAYLPSVSPSSAGSYTEPYYYVYYYEGTDVAVAKQNANYTTYGVLYNWPAAKAACPPGWHLPSDEEWTALTTWLGGEEVAGGKMKETGIAHWLSPNTGATNESGFSALPGGYRGSNGYFSSITHYGSWWPSTEYSTNDAWYSELSYYDSKLSRSNLSKEVGFSVRCVRDN